MARVSTSRGVIRNHPLGVTPRHSARRHGPSNPKEVPMTKTHSGWVTFAGVMLFIVGVLNVIYGIAAIGDSKFFIQDQKYILSNLNTWGWVTLIHRRAAALRRLLALVGWALWPLHRDPRRHPQRVRRAVVHPRVSVLVAGDLRRRHHHHLSGRDVRRRGLRGRAEPGEDPGGAQGHGDLGDPGARNSRCAGSWEPVTE